MIACLGLILLCGCKDRLVGTWQPVLARSGNKKISVPIHDEYITVIKSGKGYAIYNDLTDRSFTGTLTEQGVEFNIDHGLDTKACMTFDEYSKHLLIRLKPKKSNAADLTMLQRSILNGEVEATEVMVEFKRVED